MQEEFVFLASDRPIREDDVNSAHVQVLTVKLGRDAMVESEAFQTCRTARGIAGFTEDVSRRRQQVPLMLHDAGARADLGTASDSTGPSKEMRSQPVGQQPELHVGLPVLASEPAGVCPPARIVAERGAEPSREPNLRWKQLDETGGEWQLAVASKASSPSRPVQPPGDIPGAPGRALYWKTYEDWRAKHTVLPYWNPAQVHRDAARSVLGTADKPALQGSVVDGSGVGGAAALAAAEHRSGVHSVSARCGAGPQPIQRNCQGYKDGCCERGHCEGHCEAEFEGRIGGHAVGMLRIEQTAKWALERVERGVGTAAGDRPVSSDAGVACAREPACGSDAGRFAVAPGEEVGASQEAAVEAAWAAVTSEQRLPACQSPPPYAGEPTAGVSATEGGPAGSLSVSGTILHHRPPAQKTKLPAEPHPALGGGACQARPLELKGTGGALVGLQRAGAAERGGAAPAGVSAEEKPEPRGDIIGTPEPGGGATEPQPGERGLVAPATRSNLCPPTPSRPAQSIPNGQAELVAGCRCDRPALVVDKVGTEPADASSAAPAPPGGDTGGEVRDDWGKASEETAPGRDGAGPEIAGVLGTGSAAVALPRAPRVLARLEPEWRAAVGAAAGEGSPGRRCAHLDSGSNASFACGCAASPPARGTFSVCAGGRDGAGRGAEHSGTDGSSSPVYDRCGTYGCVLRDRHTGLHAIALGRPSRRVQGVGVQRNSGVEGGAASTSGEAHRADAAPAAAPAPTAAAPGRKRASAPGRKQRPAKVQRLSHAPRACSASAARAQVAAPPAADGPEPPAACIGDAFADEPLSLSANRLAAMGCNWLVGMRLQCYDQYLSKWQNAKVVAADGHGAGRIIKVHFDGWNAKWDEWVLLRSGRIRVCQEH